MLLQNVITENVYLWISIPVNLIGVDQEQTDGKISGDPQILLKVQSTHELLTLNPKLSCLCLGLSE